MLKSVVCRSVPVILFCFVVVDQLFAFTPEDSVLVGKTLNMIDALPVPELLPAEDSIMHVLGDLTFNRMLDKAIGYQQRSDSLYHLSIHWRKEASEMDDPAARGRLQKRIILVEDSVVIYRNQADEYFNYLNASLKKKFNPESLPEPEQASAHPFLIKDTVLNGITVYHYDLSGELMEKLAAIRQSPDPAIKKTMITGSDISDEGKPGEDKRYKGAVVPIVAENGEPVDTRAIDYQSNFKIYDRSPYNINRPFERDFSIPRGVFYRIQLAAFSKEPEPDYFGGLSPITTESVPGKNLSRYFVGKFKHMDEASSALQKVRSMGFPDAYVIGYYDGRKISLLKLKELEK